ncbi:MAG TPA: 2-phospho-L-lactate transferase CofD family protein, partial [Pirellula sp.]|nr:2-phospho-L-lactate transferase CofD family protein [Pirellula sp.]
MKIVILAGGTGSIALQTGLYHELEQNLDGFDVKVIVNAYDNGLSTGAVRQVMDGKILGPSDVRKNQTTRLALENPKSPWLAFLNIRFTEETSTVENFCKDKFSKLAAELVQNGHSSNGVQDIYDGIDEFFRSPIASRIDYNDFSLANIIYAGLARANGNSLRKAASIMAKAMGIKDNVLLNDDTSLFLGAITKSGKRITDEGDIVSWGNMEDPFVDLFFTDAAGNTTQPTLCPEAQWAIKQADLIILSTGTQWSSLIPTYASVGFRETIEASSAQILMVMNRQPDHDSPGQTASEIVNILVPKYFPANRLKIIADATGHANMLPSVNLNKQIVNWYSYDLSREIPDASKDRIHDSTKLAKAIATTFFSDYLNSDYFVFDYDDTLVGRGNVFPVCSKYNINSLTWLNGKKTHL